MPKGSAVVAPPHDTVWEALPVHEIMARFKALQLMTPDEIAALGPEAYSLAWSVANGTSMSILQTMRDSLAAHIESGKTLKSWVKELPAIMDGTGWTAVNKGHPATIFRTTLATVFEGERYKALNADDEVEYLVFDAINDDRVRESHLRLDGKAWIKPDFPEEYWPPLGYNCRCTVIPASHIDDLEAMYADTWSGKVPGVEADPGFGYAPSMRGLGADLQAELSAKALSLGYDGQQVAEVGAALADNPLPPPVTFTGAVSWEEPLKVLEAAKPQGLHHYLGGNTLQELVDLAGAPDGATVGVEFRGPERMLVRWTHEDIGTMSVGLEVTPDSTRVMTIREIVLAPGVAPGTMANVVAMQASRAKLFGYEGIKLSLVRSTVADTYFTLVNLGFDLEIPYDVTSQMPDHLRSATVQELLSKPGGLEWWRLHGVGTPPDEPAWFHWGYGSKCFPRLRLVLSQMGHTQALSTLDAAIAAKVPKASVKRLPLAPTSVAPTQPAPKVTPKGAPKVAVAPQRTDEFPLPPPNTRLDGEVELPIWECQQCGHPRYAPIQPEACEHCGAPRPKRVWPGSDRS